MAFWKRKPTRKIGDSWEENGTTYTLKSDGLGGSWIHGVPSDWVDGKDPNPVFLTIEEKFTVEIEADGEEAAEAFVAEAFGQLERVLGTKSVIAFIDEDSAGSIYKVGGYVKLKGFLTGEEALPYLVDNLENSITLIHLGSEVQKKQENIIQNFVSNSENNKFEISVVDVDNKETQTCLDETLNYYVHPEVGETITLLYSQELIEDFVAWGEFDGEMGKFIKQHATFKLLSELPQGVGEEGIDPYANGQFLCSSLVQRRIDEGITSVEVSVMDIDQDVWVVQLQDGTIKTLLDSQSGNINTFSHEHIDPTETDIRESYWRLPIFHYKGLVAFDVEENPIVKIIASP